MSVEWERLFRALFKAKTKNILEEIKLQRSLDQIRTEEKHLEKYHYTEIFNQKKVVHNSRTQVMMSRIQELQQRGMDISCELAKLKEEAESAVARRKEKATSRDMTKKQPSFTKKITGKNKKSEIPRDTSFPVVNGQKKDKGDNINQLSLNALKAKMYDRDKIRTSDKGAAKTGLVSQDKCDPSADHKCGKGARSLPVSHERTQPFTSAGRMSDIWEEVDEDEGENNIKLGKRSQTLPDLRTLGELDKVQEAVGQSVTLPVLRDTWIGQPEAIGSVRRQRRPPDELMAPHKHRSVVDVRNFLETVPNYSSCTRNCYRASLCGEAPTLPRLAQKENKPTDMHKVSSLSLFPLLSGSPITGNSQDEAAPDTTRSQPSSSGEVVVQDKATNVPSRSQVAEDLLELRRMITENANYKQVLEKGPGSSRRKRVSPPETERNGLLDNPGKVRMGGGYTGRFTEDSASKSDPSKFISRQVTAH